jgi:hypothetical protein
MHPVFRRPGAPILSPYQYETETYLLRHTGIVRQGSATPAHTTTLPAVPPTPPTFRRAEILSTLDMTQQLAQEIGRAIGTAVRLIPRTRPAKAKAKAAADPVNDDPAEDPVEETPIPKPSAPVAPPKPWTHARFWTWVSQLNWVDKSDAPDHAHYARVMRTLQPADRQGILVPYYELLHQISEALAPVLLRYSFTPANKYAFLSHIIGKGESYFVLVCADPEFPTYTITDAASDDNDFVDFHSFLHRGLPTDGHILHA